MPLLVTMPGRGCGQRTGAEPRLRCCASTRARRGAACTQCWRGGEPTGAAHRPTDRGWCCHACPGGRDLAAQDHRSTAGHDGGPAWRHPSGGQPPAASAAPGQGPQPDGDRSDPADHGAGPGDGPRGRGHGPVAGDRCRARWPAGPGRRPGDRQGDQPGCQEGSAWSPPQATGRNPRAGRWWGRWLCAGRQGWPGAVRGDRRVGQAVAATAGGQTNQRAGRGQARPAERAGGRQAPGGQAVDPHRGRQQRWTTDHRGAGHANRDTTLTDCGAAGGSGPDASRAARPARRGRFGC